MKKLLTLTLVLLLLHNINGQTIHDSVFNDVILIKNTDVITNGKDFLIDIPIKTQNEPIIIFNDDERIPTNLFFERQSFLGEQNEIILITPDWKYYKHIYESDQRTGYHSEPLTQSKIYHLDRISERIDSLTIIREYNPRSMKINFKKTEIKETELKVYYQECLGSSCCPRDPRRDFLEKVKSNVIETFEKEQNVKVTGLHKVVLGREGEHCDYLIVDNLENSQKIVVLNVLKYISKLNKPEEQIPKIFLPYIVRKIMN